MTQGVEARWDVMHAIVAQAGTEPKQKELADLTNLSPRTIGSVIARGREDGYLDDNRPVRLGVGLGMVLSVSLGSESLRAGLVDANGIARASAAHPPKPGQLKESPTKIMQRIRSISAEVLRAGIDDEALRPPGSPDLHLAGAVVAWPSPIDRSKRPKGRALAHAGWKSVSNGVVQTLPDRLAKALGAPFAPNRCHALNDVSAHALAVAFDDSRKRAKDERDERWRVVLVVRIGGGLGAGLLVAAPHDPLRLSFVDSILIEGSKGLGGELGHLPVGRRLIDGVNTASPELAKMDYDNWKCSCGKPRHLEAFASGAALLRRLHATPDYDLEETSEGHQQLLDAIISDDLDEGLRNALRDVGRVAGRALVGPILLLDPHSIVVTGSLVTDEVVDGINRERDSWASVVDDSVQIEARGGEGGAWAGVRGAALAILRRTVYRNFLDKQLDFPEVFAVSRSEVAALEERAEAA